MVRGLRLACLLLALLLPAAAGAAELRVYFFDVGQGDSALIVAPSGKTVLIDGGLPQAGPRLRARLRSILHGPLDLVLLTHPHLDHLGGLEAAMEARGARLFMDSGFEHPSPGYEALLDALKSHAIPVKTARSGRTIDLGDGATLALLWPREPFLKGTRSDANANSVVALLAFGRRHVLFSGDAEAETEAGLLQEHPGELAADVLKVPHHGSRYASTMPFLRAIHPSYAVISCGAGNDYGHPSRAALERLAAVGAKVFRTDLDGEVQLRTDGDDLQIAATRAPAADFTAPAVEARYVASKSSKVFHRADCPAAEKIKPAHPIAFATRREAVGSGRRPAKDCNP